MDARALGCELSVEGGPSYDRDRVSGTLTIFNNRFEVGFWLGLGRGRSTDKMDRPFRLDVWAWRPRAERAPTHRLF